MMALRALWGVRTGEECQGLGGRGGAVKGWQRAAES